MLFGQKELVIDDKSRLTMPSLYKEGFRDNICFATLGMDNCIELIPSELFEKNTEKINSLSNFDPKARELKRTFFSNAFRIEIDSHSRVLLPKVLLDKTNISKNVVLVGVYDHLELWDLDKFNANLKDGENNYSSNAEKILENNNGVRGN